jgi:GTP-binding protein Era
VRKSSIPSPSTGEGQGGGGKNRVIRINQIIVVERETHKKIVLGAGGAMLKGIGSNARRKIGEALGATVHLFLFVKVQETWKNDPERYRAAGLEYKN